MKIRNGSGLLLLFAALMLLFCLASCEGKKGAGKENPQEQSIPMPGDQNSTVQYRSDEVVAVVNDREITGKELDGNIDLMMKRLNVPPGMKSNPQIMDQVRTSAMEQLIINELLLQECRKKEITVDESEVSADFDSVRSKFSSSEAFQNFLTTENLTEEKIRSDIKDMKTIGKILEQEVYAGLDKVNEEDLEKEYSENKEKYIEPERVRARHVLLKADRDADESIVKEKQKKAEEILEQARKGRPFEELAQEHSEGPTASRGGDLGFFTRGQMVSEFDEAAFAASPGDIVGPVRTDFGFHVIKVETKIASRQVPFDEAREFIRPKLEHGMQEEAFKKYVDNLKSLAKIENRLLEQ